MESDNQDSKHRLYYSIKEVAKLLNEEPTTLRYWERNFPQLQPRRSGNGRRQYTLENVEVVRKIRHMLREEGFSISRARGRLEQLGSEEMRRIEILASLNRMRVLLHELRKLV